jgi:undecaprenyl-diphosphatase
VAVTLLIGGIILLFIDRFFAKNEAEGKTEVDYKTAFFIGLIQAISMIPGVSRSAATIIGGLTQGLSPTTAAEFSFFLAVPTMFAATVKSLYDFIKDEGGTFTSDELMLLGVGNVIAFLVAMLAIRSFIQFLTKHGFKAFGYYRIVVGVIILVLWAMGYFNGVEVGNF